jgi:ABC-type nickel/cobalt efflux system permease component RcnA
MHDIATSLLSAVSLRVVSPLLVLHVARCMLRQSVRQAAAAAEIAQHSAPSAQQHRVQRQHAGDSQGSSGRAGRGTGAGGSRARVRAAGDVGGRAAAERRRAFRPSASGLAAVTAPLLSARLHFVLDAAHPSSLVLSQPSAASDAAADAVPSWHAVQLVVADVSSVDDIRHCVSAAAQQTHSAHTARAGSSNAWPARLSLFVFSSLSPVLCAAQPICLEPAVAAQMTKCEDDSTRRPSGRPPPPLSL